MLKVYMTYMYRELTHTSLLFSPCFFLGQLLEMMDQSLWSTSCPTPARRGPGTPVTPPLGRATRPRWRIERRAPRRHPEKRRRFPGMVGSLTRPSPETFFASLGVEAELVGRYASSLDHPRKPSSLRWLSARSSSLGKPTRARSPP